MLVSDNYVYTTACVGILHTEELHWNQLNMSNGGSFYLSKTFWSQMTTTACVCILYTHYNASAHCNQLNERTTVIHLTLYIVQTVSSAPPFILILYNVQMYIVCVGELILGFTKQSQTTMRR